MSILPHEGEFVAILPLVRHDWLKWSVMWQVWYAQQDKS